MKKSILFLFFIGTSILGYAQNTLTGTITDTNNEPLFGVEIYAEQLHIGTTTDENGHYILKNIPNGDVQITVTYFGYKTINKIINIETNLPFNLILEEDTFSLDEVLISTPFNKLQSDNVMKVEFAKAKALKQKGVATLIEGIATIAGVSQISTGTSIGKPVIRGLSGNRVLVYAQGVRLENQQFGDEHGLGINQAGIESVEIIKGPASLLYGSDALGGVLYFNPEKFASNDSFIGDFGQQYYTNTQGISTTLGFKKSYDKWKFLIRGAYDTHLDYKIPTKKRVTNTRYNEVNLNSGIRFNNDMISSELRYNINTSNLGLTEGISTQSTSRTLENPYQIVTNQIVSLHNHIFLENSKFDVDLGYITNDRSEFEDSNQASLRMKLNTLNYDVKYHLPKFKKIELIVGAQGMHQTNKNIAEELLIPDATIDDFGLFSTAVLDFKNSSLQGGIRFDSRSIVTSKHILDEGTRIFNPIDKNYNNFTTSLGYKFSLFEDITTRINLATGYRAPNLAELTSNGVHEGINRFEIGNANLKSEQNFQVDVSLEHKNEHLELFINGFYNKLNDYIFLSPTGNTQNGNPVFNYSQDNAKLYGGEIGFHLHPHPLDWLHLESTFETVIGKQQNGKFLPLIPANKLNSTIKTEFNINKWLTEGFTALTILNTFKQINVSDFETFSDGYTLINFGAGGQIHTKNMNFEVTINANNIFNTSYISHLSRLKNDGIYAIGRNIVFGLNFKL